MKKAIFSSIFSSLFLLTSCLKEDDAPIYIEPLQGSSIAPDMGGASQKYQVWVDLSQPAPEAGEEDLRQRKTLRTAWDLGFYNGEDFRVILNYSIMMLAGSIEANNIDEVNSSNFSELLNTLNPGAGVPIEYVDKVTGDYFGADGTAIKEINANEAENKVYLVKMGYDVYQGNDIPANSTYTTGDARGFKKVKITRYGGSAYKIQYADLNETSHKEFIVTKNPDYHFTFFSIANEGTVEIQPKKQNWDICFTVFNNIIEGHGTYIYPDFILNNKLSGVASYQITTDASTLESDYTNFSIADVDENLFNFADQRAIGSTWRSTVSGTSSTPVVYADRFYVLKDANGSLFKLRFLSMLGPNNERGFPKFEYDPL